MQIGAIIRDDSRASSKADAHRPCSSNLLVTFSSIGVSIVCKQVDKSKGGAIAVFYPHLRPHRCPA